MDERLNNPEHAEPLLSTPEHAEVALPTAEQATPLKPGETVQNLEQARSDVERQLDRTEANPIEQLTAAKEYAQPMTPHQVNRELRQITLRRELQGIRRQLPAPQRTFSKLIHQPAVRVISETAGKTVSRPSGLLGGGLVAFIGTSAYVYLAKHVGFTYNYFVFFVLLIVGFVLGVVLEYIVYLVTHSRRQHD